MTIVEITTTKALAECGQIACTIDRRRAAKESYHRYRRLLRALLGDEVFELVHGLGL